MEAYRAAVSALPLLPWRSKAATLITGTLLSRSSQSSSRTFATLKDIKDLPSIQKKVTGRFGVEWYLGRRPTETNSKMAALPKPVYDPKPYMLQFRKYPGVVSGLGAEYYYREGQRAPVTYYHMRSPVSGDTVMVGATDPRAREARTIDNYAKERTRGFAVQILLEGRGVKAYMEPAHPYLKARLGVGDKVKDLSEYCKRDPDVNVTVSKKGDVVMLHGPNKARVGHLAYRLLRKMQPRNLTYTGKGAHFAFHAVRRKAVRKK